MIKIFKQKQTPTGESLKSAVANFKAMLVKRYNWSVGKAYKFSHPELRKQLLSGKSVQEAYCSLFKVEQDLQQG